MSELSEWVREMTESVRHTQPVTDYSKGYKMGTINALENLLPEIKELEQIMKSCREKERP